MSLSPFTPKPPAADASAANPWSQVAREVRREVIVRRHQLGILLVFLGIAFCMFTSPWMSEGARLGLKWSMGALALWLVFQAGRVMQAQAQWTRLKTNGDAPASAADAITDLEAMAPVAVATARVESTPAKPRPLSALPSYRPTTPQGEVFSSTALAQAKGWEFFNRIGQLGDEEIPQWASLGKDWFEYEGIHNLQQAVPVDRRVFGHLSFRKAENPNL